MNVSKTWLQKYIVEPLPSVKDIADKLTMYAFEIESIVSDDVIDVKILPDRAHYALSHYGVASDIAVAFGFTLKPRNEIKLPETSKELEVKIEDEKICRRYTGAIIKGVKVGPSPEWLKNSLEAIGQRSINNIVDATNYVMFSVGQPTHVFDLAKIKKNDAGIKIEVKKLQQDEKIVALDNKPYELKSGTLVIADNNSGKTLAIAGVKGGSEALVDENTTDVLLESANFDPVIVRKTGRSLGLVTDAQKRFENEITPELAIQGLSDLIALILEVAGGTVEGYIDVYPQKTNAYKVGVSLREINEVLGTDLKAQEVEDIINKFGWIHECVTPHEKVVSMSQELVGKPYKYGADIYTEAPNAFDCSSFTAYLYKESGILLPCVSVDQYVWGDAITEDEAVAGDLVFSNTHINIRGIFHTETKEFLKGTKIEKALDHVGMYLGDGKVIHATQGGDGVVVIENLSESTRFPEIIGYRRMAKLGEKRWLITVPAERIDIRIKEDLIEEIGRIYGYEHVEAKMPVPAAPLELNQQYVWCETLRSQFLASGYSEVYTYAFRPKGDIEIAYPLAADKAFLRINLKDGVSEALELNKKYKDLLGLKEVKIFEIGNVFTKDGESMHVCFANEKEVQEMSLEEAVEHMKIQEVKELPEANVSTNIFKPFSLYPFIVRDIAVWIPDATSPDEITEMIVKDSGELLIKGPTKFDQFSKEGRTSYAYRMVYQSMDRTLTIEEVNTIITATTEKMNNKEGWKVR
jgi:phenylalanyl-tRNA synthetase beta subunit